MQTWCSKAEAEADVVIFPFQSSCSSAKVFTDIISGHIDGDFN